jgi:peptidase M23-like protein
MGQLAARSFFEVVSFKETLDDSRMPVRSFLHIQDNSTRRTAMSWDDIMRRVLPPTGGFAPHVTSRYSDTNRPPHSTNPHRAVDLNHDVGPNGQRGINLTHPVVRSPASGIVTKAGGDKFGTIAIRDRNGFSHEILHTQARHAAVGDPVAAGALIGTMGKTGADAHHVHYQLKDPSGKAIDPSAFWDQQGPVDPNPAPPTYLGEQQQYAHDRNAIANNSFGNVPDAELIYGPLAVDEPQPLVLSPPRSVDPRNIRVLTGRIAGHPPPQRFNPTAAAMSPNEFPVADG